MHMQEEQDKQRHMLEAVLQQLNDLVASYEQSAINHNSGEGSFSKQVSDNPLFEGEGVFMLDLLDLSSPSLMGLNLWNGFLWLNSVLLILVPQKTKNFKLPSSI